jgi:hypothetical protein
VYSDYGNIKKLYENLRVGCVSRAEVIVDDDSEDSEPGCVYVCACVFGRVLVYRLVCVSR